MRRFLLHGSLFALLVLGSMLGVFLLADGTTDPYYLRFTTPHQRSLVVGTSRAAQGVVPSVLNEAFALAPREGFFNFSFTKTMSPFGPAYHDRIQRKLKPADDRPAFAIITVDPWALAVNVADTLDLREWRTPLGKTPQVTGWPNFHYLLHAYGDPYATIVGKRFKKHPFRLHEDGWLEVLKEYTPAIIERKTARKLAIYRSELLPVMRPSATRWKWLERTVASLAARGDACLVRMPVHGGMLALDDLLMPGLDARLEALSARYGIPYFNFRDEWQPYTYTDGHHLERASARRFTAELARRWKAWLDAR